MEIFFGALFLGAGSANPEDDGPAEDEDGGGNENVDFLDGAGSFVANELAGFGTGWGTETSLSLPLSLSLP